MRSICNLMPGLSFKQLTLNLEKKYVAVCKFAESWIRDFPRIILILLNVSLPETLINYYVFTLNQYLKLTLPVLGIILITGWFFFGLQAAKYQDWIGRMHNVIEPSPGFEALHKGWSDESFNCHKNGQVLNPRPSRFQSRFCSLEILLSAWVSQQLQPLHASQRVSGINCLIYTDWELAT